MPKRGKHSSYLKGFKGKGRNSSSNRHAARHIGKDQVSSTKVAVSAYKDQKLYVANKYKRRIGRKGVITDTPIKKEEKPKKAK